MLSDDILRSILPELSESLSGRIESLLGEAGRDVFVAVLREYLVMHGAELMAPVVEIERIKRKKLLSPEEVEKAYGIKRRTLDDWRFKKIGPEYEKPGGQIKYRSTTLDAFCRASRVLTSESPNFRAAS